MEEEELKTTARINTRDVEVRSVKQIKTVVLELTEKDASVLLKVLNNVGGLSSGPRGVIDRIGNALYTAGVQPIYTKTVGAIYFR